MVGVETLALTPRQGFLFLNVFLSANEKPREKSKSLLNDGILLITGLKQIDEARKAWKRILKANIPSPHGGKVVYV